MNISEIKAVIMPHLKGWVREVLQEILLTSSEPEVLLKPKDAIEKLGYADLDSLYDDITAGLLRVGKEVYDRRKPGAQRANWLVDVEACKKRFAEDPETRRAV